MEVQMKSEVQLALDANIPKEVIETREQAGRSLSYLSTWYVIDRLNQVIGQGNWSYSINKLDKVFEGNQTQRNGEVFATSYIAQVTLMAMIQNNKVEFTDVGYGDGTDKTNPGKAHELATKEAVSDGLKRAAKNLGRSMGLALYDKTQEYVDKPTSKSSTRSTTTNTTETKPSVLRTEQVVTKSETIPGKTVSPNRVSERPIKELLKEAFKVLEAQKKIDGATFKSKYLNGEGLTVIDIQSAVKAYKAIKTDFPTLNL